MEKIARNYVKKCCTEEVEKEKLDEYLKKIDQLKVAVDLNNDTAKISCCFCKYISTTYSVQNSKHGKKWTLSNFNKHVKTHFRSMKTDQNSKNVIKNSTMLSFVTINQNVSGMASTRPDTSRDTVGDCEVTSDVTTETCVEDDSFFDNRRNGTEATVSAESKAESNELHTSHEIAIISKRGERYSRQARKLKSLEAFDENQSKITDFFLERLEDTLESNTDGETILTNFVSD